jgi:pimeloyl-ACP methyl ester carboxylesterase
MKTAPPRTRYARSGDVNIAYQVVGEGPRDLVYVSGWVSHLEVMWEEPTLARFLEGLASFSRLILFDKRGTGLSDRVSPADLPTLEQRMDDLRTVLDAVGSERTALFGHSEGGNMSILFTATHPERTTALVTFGIFAKRIWSPDYPWAPTPEKREQWFEKLEREWGGPVDIATLAPSMAGERRFEEWFASYLRMGASPGAAVTLGRMNTAIDVRSILPVIQVPTLVLHRKGDLDVKIEEARFIAERISGARLVELPGDDHLPWVGDQDSVLDEIETFLTGDRPAREPERVLATVMFTDIIQSTERAALLGDAAWRELRERHDAIVRRELDRHRGREVNTMGDGFVATFDGPARGIRCALAIRDALREIGLEVRTGLHTGEVEMRGDSVGGIAVHIGARVTAAADPGAVLVSSTAKDLVAGSGIAFDDRGAHSLKGVPGEWRLFAVVA